MINEINLNATVLFRRHRVLAFTKITFLPNPILPSVVFLFRSVTLTNYSEAASFQATKTLPKLHLVINASSLYHPHLLHYNAIPERFTCECDQSSFVRLSTAATLTHAIYAPSNRRPKSPPPPNFSQERPATYQVSESVFGETTRNNNNNNNSKGWIFEWIDFFHGLSAPDISSGPWKLAKRAWNWRLGTGTAGPGRGLVLIWFWRRDRTFLSVTVWPHIIRSFEFEDDAWNRLGNWFKLLENKRSPDYRKSATFRHDTWYAKARFSYRFTHRHRVPHCEPIRDSAASPDIKGNITGNHKVFIVVLLCKNGNLNNNSACSAHI